MRTGLLLVLVITLSVRFSIIKDSFFNSDDFALTTKAIENHGWGYLTEIGTGHFSPFALAVMWLLAHVAPWNWGAAALLLILGELVVAVLVWRLLTELFGRRLLVLAPFALYCLSPLTAPAFTWLAAALAALPLMAALAGALHHHVRYLRLGGRRDVVMATLWVLFGMASFEKILIYFPFVVVLTLALSPNTVIRKRPLLALIRRTWLIWAAYLATALAYVILYVARSGPHDGTALISLPPWGQFLDFANISVLRTFVPGAFGGPWAWATSAMVNSPRAFEWICWTLALAVVGGTLMLRHRIGRAWTSLAVYLLCSFVVVGVGRLHYYDSWIGLSTRYLTDAVLPLTVVVGMCLLPLRDETNAWRPVAQSVSTRLPRAVRAGVGSVAGLMVVALAFHSLNGFATLATANPYRAFALTARESLAALPASAQVYDEPLPVNVLGPMFGNYNLISRFLAPVATVKRRHEMYALKSYTNPYYLTKEGHFVRMNVAGMESPERFPGVCGWTSRTDQIAVPLTESAYPWTWTVRVGYLAGLDTQATIVLGKARQQVQLHKGLGEVYLPMVGGGSEVRVEGLNPEANVCVGDVQVGHPAPKK
ncbi:MAG: hypothetical protein HHJ13_17110 [Phycicoccus sp.]|nr:hypothetical protein [Phycicoccus sp.]